MLVVGADEADELDAARRGPAGGGLVERERIASLGGRALVGRASLGGAVACWLLYGLKRASAMGELLATGEALLAKEALVEGVVEVLDRAVASWLAGGDEHWGRALMQAVAQDLPDAGRRDERAAVVELHAARHGVAGPPRVQATDHALVAAIGDDLDPP